MIWLVPRILNCLTDPAEMRTNARHHMVRYLHRYRVPVAHAGGPWHSPRDSSVAAVFNRWAQFFKGPRSGWAGDVFVIIFVCCDRGEFYVIL